LPTIENQNIIRDLRLAKPERSRSQKFNIAKQFSGHCFLMGFKAALGFKCGFFIHITTNGQVNSREVCIVS